jgi:hypothetical protein
VRTTAQQRIVLLSFTTNTVMACLILLVSIWRRCDDLAQRRHPRQRAERQVFAGAGGRRTHGHLLLTYFFVFPCVVGPTTMAIASEIAVIKTKNANANVMGTHQTIKNSGQAYGPLLGAVLLKISLLALLTYLICSELLVACMNAALWWQHGGGCLCRALHKGGRRLFDLSKLPTPDAVGKGNGAPLPTPTPSRHTRTARHRRRRCRHRPPPAGLAGGTERP